MKNKVLSIWLYFMRRTIRSGYAGTTTNIQIVLNTPKNPFLNQATEKILAKISYPQKPGVDHFKPPPKSLDHHRHHSRPQSPSFLGHVVGKPGVATGRLQIKPSGSGDENASSLEIWSPPPLLGERSTDFINWARLEAVQLITSATQGTPVATRRKWLPAL